MSLAKMMRDFAARIDAGQYVVDFENSNAVALVFVGDKGTFRAATVKGDDNKEQAARRLLDSLVHDDGILIDYGD